MKFVRNFLRIFKAMTLPTPPALSVLTVDELRAISGERRAGKSYATAVERQRLMASAHQASAPTRQNGGSTVVSMQEWQRRKSHEKSNG